MEYAAGDILFIHGDNFFDKLIQWGQRLRFSEKDSFFNHVAIILNPQGDIIEAVADGVKINNISKYRNLAYMKIIHLEMSDEDRSEMLAFANSCVKEGYGYINIISSSLCVLFGLKFVFGFDGTDICSGVVGKSLEHAGKILNRDTDHCTPADILQYLLT